MGGRKRTASGTTLEYSTNTENTSDPSSDSDSDDEQLIPSTSKRIKQHLKSSWIDYNNELLKENPFLIRNVLACLCEHSSRQALFKYRLVGQHIWNKLAVNAINEDKSMGVRLAKLVDPNMVDDRCHQRLETVPAVAVINIRELISTLNAGRLEKSTLTRIYMNSSLTDDDDDLNEFLKLNGQNIRTLHYDGVYLQHLRLILQTCAKNLMCLSLWFSWDEGEDGTFNNKEGLFENIEDGFQFPRLENLVIVSGELNPRMSSIHSKNNICNPSKEFLTHIFQASPNLKSLSVRFYDSFILDSGLSFKNLTTLCIKFKIRIPQLRTLCDVGLKLKKLRLQGLFIYVFQVDTGEDEHYRYMDDPEWMEFRKILLEFIQTQANTLEYFSVCLFAEKDFQWATEHDSPHEQWNSMTGFPRMPNLQTLILHECSGKIPKEEFGYLFPKLKNMEIVGCRHRQVAGPPEPYIVDYPLVIPVFSNPSIFVQNIRGIKPTMELAQIFPSVIELHIQKTIPRKLPTYWPKLKHLYYKESCYEDRETKVVAYIRRINTFLIGISPQESKRIEKEANQYYFDLTNLELPRSRPSIFDLNDLETFEFGFSSYEFKQTYSSRGLQSALGVLVSMGLSRLTSLKKLNFVLEQKQRPSTGNAFPKTSLNELANTFQSREYLNVSSNYNERRKEPKPRKWTLELNLDHHKSEWMEIDGLFRDDPDICDLGLSIWSSDDSDED